MRAVLVALGLLVAIPAIASAQVQVSTGGDALAVVGQNVDADVFTVTFVPNVLNDPADDEVVVSGPDVEFVGGDVACTSTPPVQVVCPLAGLASTTWTLNGFSGDDTITVAGPAHAGYAVEVFGGDGNDALTGGPGVERLEGEAGNDTLRDGLGNDVVRGGLGNDTLLQSALAGFAPFHDEDDIDLGGGTGDVLSYAARTAADAVTLRIGEGDGSGTPGELDDLADGIEHVIATAGDDTLVTRSSSDPIVLDAGAGNDTFVASSFVEQFIGGAGIDTVSYVDAFGEWGISGVRVTPDGVADDGDPDVDDPGADGTPDDNVMPDVERIIGSSGDDQISGAALTGCRIAGGDGLDTLTAPATGCILEGGNKADVLLGGAGDDTLRPGASGTAASDQLTFGGGVDTVDYATSSLVSTDSTIAGVQASAAPAAAAWCYGLGLGTTSARKSVGALPHLDRWVDAPERLLGTVVSDTLCGGSGATVLDGGGAADVLIGGAGNDTIVGGAGNDLANGQGGADTLDGGEGNDNLNGGAGNDVVFGGEGDDTAVRGGGGSDQLYGGPGNDVLDEVLFSTVEQGLPEEELDAADLLVGGPGADTIDGASGDDVIACDADLLGDTISDSGDGTETIDCSAMGAGVSISVGAGFALLVGTSFDDALAGAARVVGGAGNDVLTAGEAGSTLEGGDGSDDLRGGPGADVLLGGTGADTLTGGGGNDTLTGGDGNDTISGGDGTDVLAGEDGADSLAGDGGDDTLDGGAGPDTISGGAGTEVLDFSGSSVPVVVTLDGVADDGRAGEGDNVLADVERLVGGGGDDRFVAGATGIAIDGGGGDDVLVGGAGADTLTGAAGNDRIEGGGGANVLDGGDGNDVLVGGADAEQLLGGAGTDSLDGGMGADAISGGTGSDTVSYAARRVPVVVTIGAGKTDDGQARERDDVRIDVEHVTGGRGNDRLVGGRGANTLRGGAGNDRLMGGIGNDRLDGGAGVDRLDGGLGNDRLDGGAGNDRLDGGVGNDRLDGGIGVDQHRGGSGNDMLLARDRSKRDRAARELVDGGAGRDSARVDPRDRLLGIERRLR